MRIKNDTYENSLLIVSLISFEVKILLFIPYLILIDNNNKLVSIFIFIILSSLLIGLRIKHIINLNKFHSQTKLTFLNLCLFKKELKLTPPFKVSKNHLIGIGPRLGGTYKKELIKLEYTKNSNSKTIFIAHEKYLKELISLINLLNPV